MVATGGLLAVSTMTFCQFSLASAKPLTSVHGIRAVSLFRNSQRLRLFYQIGTKAEPGFPEAASVGTAEAGLLT